MIRIFIDNKEFTGTITSQRKVEILFVFDDGDKFKGILTFYDKEHRGDKYYLSIRFSDWENRNSRICKKLFKKLGINLEREKGIEKIERYFTEDSDYVIPYPPAFPILRNYKGFLGALLRSFIDKNEGEPKTELERDLRLYCSDFCMVECTIACPLNKYRKNVKNN
jgi:hypothetical protein